MQICALVGLKPLAETWELANTAEYILYDSLIVNSSASTDAKLYIVSTFSCVDKVERILH